MERYIFENIKRMFCTPKEWDTCGVEKLGCEGCYYFKEEENVQMNKKLVSIEKINDIEPINDDLELIHLSANDCISKKGLFKKDEFVVCFRKNSLVPTNTVLEAYKLVPEDFIISISSAIEMYDRLNPELLDLALPSEFMSLEVGTDVTELFKVKECV